MIAPKKFQSVERMDVTKENLTSDISYCVYPQEKFQQCNKCPYIDKNRTKETDDFLNFVSEKNLDVLIVGDKPGYDDIPFNENKYAPGRFGFALNSNKWYGIKNFIDKECRINSPIKWYLTTAVMCYNELKTTGDDYVKAIRQCGVILSHKITLLKPKVVILMGRQACKATSHEKLFKLTSIEKNRGEIIEHKIGDHKFFIIPTHSISDVNKAPDLWSTLLHDFKKAKNIAINGYIKSNIKKMSENYIFPKTFKEIKGVLEPLIDRQDISISFDIETTGLSPHAINADVLAISFAWGKGLACAIPTKNLCNNSWGVIKKLLESSTPKIPHNGKFDIGYLLITKGINVNNLQADTMLNHYLIDENRAGGEERNAKGEYTLKKLVWDFLPEYGGYEENNNVINFIKSGRVSEILEKDLLLYAAADTDMTFQLFSKQLRYLFGLDLNASSETVLKTLNSKGKNEEKKIYSLATGLMTEATYAAVKLETGGFKIDKKYLEDIQKKVNIDVIELKKEIEELFPGELNIDAIADQRKIVFDHLGYSPIKGRQTPTGLPVLDKKVRLKLLEEKQNSVLEKIHAYKTVQKLNSSFLKNINNQIFPDGKVHPSYKLIGTVTGRLSCSNPNLHNAPKYMTYTLKNEEHEVNVKKIFVPDSDFYTILTADYSQLEMVILAAHSEDPFLIEALVNNLDLHSFVASKVFGYDYDEIFNKVKVERDKKFIDMRTRAKAVGFGIVYGTTKWGLAKNLGVDLESAQLLIDNFLNKFSKIKDYINNKHYEAQRYGYVLTKSGRRRRFPIIEVRRAGLDSSSKRKAQNSPVQGDGSDITLKSVCETSERFPEEIKGRILTTVHDSVVTQIPKTKIKEGKNLLLEIMVTNRLKENKWLGKVPLRIDTETGDSWGTTGEIE